MLMTAEQSTQLADLPGSDLDVAKMPGHWLLARLGKRVLRPGGLGLTRALLDSLAIGPDDDVVEFAPGLGVTARMILERKPRRYVGVERDAKAMQWTARQLPRSPNVSVVVGAADQTNQPDGSASVVIGEAMLSMHTQERKRLIAAEAFRLLRPGGRYGIHELAVVPDDMPADQKQEIDGMLSSVIHVGTRSLPEHEWRALLEGVGFRVVASGYAPMHLLRPRRLVQDEGVLGALRLAKNLLLDSAARRRVVAMRRVFEHYRNNLGAIYLIAQKGLD
jgi:SAM-dependent methyltransferase